METIEHLRELFIFNDWANRRILISLKSNSSEKAIRILTHLLITEKEYFERLYDKDLTGFDFWRNLSLEDCERLLQENVENYQRFLDKIDDRGHGQIARYKTSEGVSHENTWLQLLTHILFHSATHRGNIVAALREKGFTPPKIDYIIFLRETS
jgi:uncharacterized damage-inducible protein DinB